MSNLPSLSKHLVLHGRVQGVYYRESMCQQAARLGISGWVRNRRDGTVEAMIQGSEEAIARMLEWARRGPEMAQVTNMEVREGSGNHSGFERRETA